MMRNVARVVLNVIAGFFFYMVCLLGFIDGPSIGCKMGNHVWFHNSSGHFPVRWTLP